MAYDVISKAHPELEEALRFAVAAVVSEGPECSSPVRVCAEKLVEYNSRIDVHRHSRQGGGIGGASRGSRSSGGVSKHDSDAGESSFAHCSRDEWDGRGGGGDGEGGDTVSSHGAAAIVTRGAGTATAAAAAGTTTRSSMLLASGPIQLGSSGGGVEVAGAGGQRLSTESSGAAAAAREEERRRQQAHAGRGRRQVVFSEPVRLDADWRPVVVPKAGTHTAEIAAVLHENILFGGIDDDAKQVIIDAMTPRDFALGDVIIQQGDAGDFYYVLSQGACDITVDGRLVLKARKGMGFGELALLYDAPRAATVTVTSDVAHTWALDRPTFKQVMIGSTIRKRELYEEFLRGVPLFSTLTRSEVLIIADALQPVRIRALEAVVVQGDAHADRFYIVEDGELKAEMSGVPGEVCDRLVRGSYFGERALIKDEPRAATVTAVRDSKCLAMDRASFIRLLGPISDLLARNEEMYAQYVSAARTRGHDSFRAHAGLVA